MRVRLDGSIEAVKLSTGVPHVVRLSPVPVTLLQALDIHFGNERVIFLPGRDEPQAAGAAASDDDNPASPPVAGIDVAAAAFQFARYNPKRMLVVGHADKVGSDSVNMTVSRDRAENVLLYLTAGAPVWADHCQGHYAVDDVQNILTWVAQALGWPVTPGKVDNQMGKNTRGALEAFRREYNRDFGASIEVEGPVCVDDWVAFYEVFDEVIGERLGQQPGSSEAAAEEVPDGEERRQAITVLGEGLLACGEQWPRADCNVVDYPDGGDRRVDILFLDEDELGAEALLSEDPPGDSLYGQGRVRTTELELEARDFGAATYEVWARISSHWLNRSVSGEAYLMRGPRPHAVVFREGTTTAQGELRETGVPAGNYEIEIAGSVIPVAAHIEDHAVGGFDVPSDLQLPGLAQEERPLHLSAEAITHEWIVPAPEAGDADEPDPMAEDGVP